MAWHFRSKTGTTRLNIIRKYPTKYSKVMLFLEAFESVLTTVILVLLLLSWTKIDLGGYFLFLGLVWFILTIIWLILMILDFRQRRRGDPHGKYWNYL